MPRQRQRRVKALLKGAECRETQGGGDSGESRGTGRCPKSTSRRAIISIQSQGRVGSLTGREIGWEDSGEGGHEAE
eukprot:2679596-Rhodomonas_salina.2